MLRKRYPEYCLTVLLSALILSIIVLSWVPPVSRDALTHHLAVPKLYIEHGGMYEIPSMKFSYYPMNLELLYMIPMVFGNDILPKWIHFLFALATTYLMYRYLKKRLTHVYALFGCLLFLSVPIIVKLSITAYVDLGLVFFSTASVLLLIRWTEEDFQLRYLVYSAICCGLALGTKYNGLVVLLILTLFVPCVYIRGHANDEKKNKSLFKQLKALGWGVIFIVAALMVFSPWMVRNYRWKGNPIYPLYHSIMISGESRLSEKNDRKNISFKIKDYFSQDNRKKGRWNHFSIRRFIYKESWWQILLIPLRIFFQGEDGNPKYFDGKLNPLLIILPLFAFIYWRREAIWIKRDLSIFMSYSVSFILFAFLAQDMRIRYIAPAIPSLVILSVFGYRRLLEVISEKIASHYQKSLSYLILAAIGILMMMNLWYLIDQFKYIQPFDYISGKLNRKEYITKFRPEYPVIQYANDHLNEGSTILGIFMGNRRYYSDNNMVFNEKLIFAAVRKNMPAIEILKKVQQSSITHMIIWEPYFIRWGNNNFDNEQLIILKTFFKRYTRLLFSNDGYTLLQLIDPENSSKINND